MKILWKNGKKLLFLQVKLSFMKKILLILLFFSVIVMFLPSCERRCICTYLEDGTEELISSAYTKKECMDYEDEINALGMNLDCDYKRVK